MAESLSDRVDRANALVDKGSVLVAVSDGFAVGRSDLEPLRQQIYRHAGECWMAASKALEAVERSVAEFDTLLTLAERHERLADRACLDAFLIKWLNGNDSLRAIAKRPRPGARNPIKAKVETYMRRELARGKTFDAFVSDWMHVADDGLSLTRLLKSDPQGAVQTWYEIDDENGGPGAADFAPKEGGFKSEAQRC